MNKLLERRCKSCGTQLPLNARANTKYCSKRCSERERKRRYRQRQRSEIQVNRDPLLEAENSIQVLEVEQFKLKQKLADKDRHMRRLQNALRTAEHQVEVAASEQALRTRAVRDELAMSQSQVANLKRNWSVRSAADDETVTKLRSELATVTDEYNELATKYKHLTAAAKSAVEERKNLQGIVRQWDYLCKRLHVATKGRPRNDSDKKILATWSQFRKRVRK